MPSVFFSPKASEDLENIKQYIQSQLGSPVAANKRVLDILGSIDKIAIFPEIGPSLKKKLPSLAQYRFLTTSGNIIIYRIEGDRILIIRILGTQTDYLKLLDISQ